MAKVTFGFVGIKYNMHIFECRCGKIKKYKFKSLAIRNKYCSHSCFWKYDKNFRNKIIASNKKRTGNKSGTWKGGKTITFQGYVLIHRSLIPDEYKYLANEQRNRYAREHRLVMAMNMKRKLTKEDLVHHLNGIRDDNRPENLAIVNKNNHERKTLLVLAYKRIKELEAKCKKLEKI